MGLGGLMMMADDLLCFRGAAFDLGCFELR